MEKILQENDERFVLFPIKHQGIMNFYDMAESAFWRTQEVDLSNDYTDWLKLNDNERYFLKQILSFFAASDGIVNENLAENFYREVKYPEAKFFYGFQIMMENIHSKMYSLMINEYIKSTDERNECFNALQTLPIVSKKADWAFKWIQSNSFAERLIAFAAVEGIFFSGSFCSIFWIKERALMPGLCLANDFISRDEALHCDFAIYLLNNHLEEKPSKERIIEIIQSALEIEKEFMTESLPVSLIGMNKNLMIQYLEYVSDQLLIKLGCGKIYNSTNPFPFTEKLALQSKTNFFEQRPSEYKKADISGEIIVNTEMEF
jgi:ribonucleoside-diphosphate reductase beta chain